MKIPILCSLEAVSAGGIFVYACCLVGGRLMLLLVVACWFHLLVVVLVVVSWSSLWLLASLLVEVGDLSVLLSSLGSCWSSGLGWHTPHTGVVVQGLSHVSFVSSGIVCR